MRVSTKGRYALRVMMDLARHKDEGYISLKDIAERQEISKNYLDQIMMLFKSNGFFKVTRGHQGGYKLAKEPCEYTVGDILRVTEGGIAPVACLEDGGEECPRSESCAAMKVWKGLEDVMERYLDGVTLENILNMCD